MRARGVPGGVGARAHGVARVGSAGEGGKRGATFRGCIGLLRRKRLSMNGPLPPRLENNIEEGIGTGGACGNIHSSVAGA